MRKQVLLIVGFFLIGNVAFSQFKLYEKGCESYKAGNYEEAINFFSEFMSKATHDKALEVEVHYLRALSFYKKENYGKAVEDFEDAILLNHKNRGNIYWFLAKSQDKLGFYNESVECYSSAIRDLTDKDSHAKLLFERSQAYTKLGNLELAFADLETGGKLHPGNADIKNELDRLAKSGVALRGSENNKTDHTQKANPQEENKTLASEKKESDKEVKISEKEAVLTQSEESEPTLEDLYKEEKRYALVIGNSAYPRNIGELKNPVNDATDIAAELANSGFQVQLLVNATYGQIRVAMMKFKEKVDAGDREKTVALFYYAGHGLQHDDENYLVPIDASIEFEDDIPRYCFPIQRMVLSNMERSNSRMNIVILDACRNNPFPSLTRSLGGQGLGEMKKGRGAFIAYATAPGSVASDGTGRNGLYTQELLKAMRKSGKTIEQVFKEVRQNVLKLSNDKQNTWDSSNIIGEFHFKF